MSVMEGCSLRSRNGVKSIPLDTGAGNKFA